MALSVVAELAWSFALLGRSGIDPEVLEPAGDLVLGAGEVGSADEASPMIPPTTARAIPTPTATIASIISAAPSARGTRWPCIQPTTGEATAATIPAASTGSTITWVSESSQMTPTSKTPRPTRSQAVSPAPRSQSGTRRCRSARAGRSRPDHRGRGSASAASSGPEIAASAPVPALATGRLAPPGAESPSQRGSVSPRPLLRRRPRARRPVGASCGTRRTARGDPRGSARAAPPEGRGSSRRC